MNTHIPVKHLLPAWEAFRSAVNIAPISDAEHYQRMVSMLEALLDDRGVASHWRIWVSACKALVIITCNGSALQRADLTHRQLF